MKHHIIIIGVLIITFMVCSSTSAFAETKQEEYSFYSLINYGGPLSLGAGYYSTHNIEFSVTGFIMGYHSKRIGLQVDTYMTSISVPAYQGTDLIALGDIIPLRLKYSPFEVGNEVYPFIFGEMHYLRFKIEQSSSGPSFRPEEISFQTGIGFKLNHVKDSSSMPIEIKIGVAQDLGIFIDAQLLFGGYRRPKTIRKNENRIES